MQWFLQLLIVVVGVAAAGVLGYVVIEWLSGLALRPPEQALAVVLVIAAVGLVGYLIGQLNRAFGGK